MLLQELMYLYYTSFHNLPSYPPPRFEGITPYFFFFFFRYGYIKKMRCDDPIAKISEKRKKVRVSYIYSVMHAFMYAYRVYVHTYSCMSASCCASKKKAFCFRSHIFLLAISPPLPNASSMYCRPKCKSSSLFSSVRTRTRLVGRFRSRQPIPLHLESRLRSSDHLGSPLSFFFSFHSTFSLKRLEVTSFENDIIAIVKADRIISPAHGERERKKMASSSSSLWNRGLW